MTSSIRSFVITTATVIIRVDDMDGATAVLNTSTIVLNPTLQYSPEGVHPRGPYVADFDKPLRAAISPHR